MVNPRTRHAATSGCPGLRMWLPVGLLLLSLVTTLHSGPVAAAPTHRPVPSPATRPAAEPLMRDFMGVCTHTIQFKPELYRPVARLARDYHSLGWDVGNETDFKPQFPFARNRVDWSKVYGSWKEAGIETDVSLMLGETPPDKWADLPRDARAFGEAFARYFGPGGKDLVSSFEIGNEPGHYDDATYRKLFENMAKGLRAGDPKMTVVTCNMTAGKSGKYVKSLECVKGLDDLYEVINVHTYAEAEPWPTWRRSYPEDPKLRYLADVRDVLRWRDQHAPGKRVWITEFGWDASTKPAPKEGDFKRWVGSTETEQARYVVRSFLVFAAMDVERAYVYWFNDDDKPQIHGSSGLTRNYKPKPAYWAVAHLHASLGDYRFARAVTERPGEWFDYEFVHEKDAGKRVRVVWSPTGSNRTAEATVALAGGKVVEAERMPLAEGKPEAVKWEPAGDGAVRLTVDESPVYLWLERE